MSRKFPSIEQLMKNRGYSRREFLYLCGAAAAAAGLDSASVPNVVKSFENSPRRLVLRVLFACPDSASTDFSVAHTIANDLICEVKCFGLSGTLKPAQATRFAERLTAAHRGRDFMLLIEGSPVSPESDLSFGEVPRDARSIVSAECGPVGDVLFSAASADLLSQIAPAEDADLLDGAERSAALEGFCIYRAGLFGAAENLGRLPYLASGPSRRWMPPRHVSSTPRFGGLALHALTSNVPKHKLIRENLDGPVSPFGNSTPNDDRANFSRGGSGRHRLQTGDK